MASPKVSKSFQILNKCFQDKKLSNAAYSQRALARDLGVSSVFVTKVLTGQKGLPPERYKKIFHILNMDSSMQSTYLKAVVMESLPSAELRSLAKKALQENSKFENYERVPAKHFSFLRQWYNVPILSYLTCEGLESSVEAIAKYFSLSAKDVETSLQQMQKAELVKLEDGKWIKIAPHSYFPTTKFLEDVRNFHRQMIEKSYKELSKTSAADFEKRMVTGFSIAVNPENLDKARRLITDFMGELSHELSEGSCEEVYQCNLQLIPLRAAKDSK